MKRLLLAFISVALMAGMTMPLYAGTGCATKYPIVLVHGLGFKDKNLMGINYWWGIPGALKNEGAVVYVTNQDVFNGVAERAQDVAKELGEQFVLHPEWQKVNIIAHSMGPLDSRYLISNLAIPGKGPAKDYVASLTSISGTHGGSEIADVMWKTRNGIPVLGSVTSDMISAAVNAFGSIFFYDENDPDCLNALYNLTTDFVKNIFNPNTPDMPGILYQSWGAKINYIGLTPTDQMMGPQWLLMLAMGAGDNDGQVSVSSAKWGIYRGTLTTSILLPGVNHFYEVGQLTGYTPGFNAPQFYINVVKELKSKGY